MIEFVLRWINARLEALAMFQDIRLLVERITKDEQTFPAQYLTKGEYKQVSDADFVKGIVYHRITGAVTREEIEQARGGCDVQVRQTYPMRLVCCAPKNTFTADDAFADVKFAENIINTLTQKNIKPLSKQFRADVVSIQSKNFNVDRSAILADEFTGFDFQVNYEYVYLAVDYNVVIEAPASCFAYWLCNGALEPLDLCPPLTIVDGGDSGDDDQFGEEVVPDLACDTTCEDHESEEGGDASTQFNIGKGITP